MNDLALVLSAARFAAERHRDQRRKDAAASPYINHPLQVAEALATIGGVDDATVLAAALLHDTVEDCGVAPAELVERFGAAVAAIVAEVTDDRTLSKAARKQAQIAHAASRSRGAKLVKLGDKLCNVRDVAGAVWTAERKAEYVGWAGQVVDRIRGTNAALEAAFDAAARAAGG
jgi:guanosine-3',5'-bis(diphosphate) 3'-pyrophosphohydrolase